MRTAHPYECLTLCFESDGCGGAGCPEGTSCTGGANAACPTDGGPYFWCGALGGATAEDASAACFEHGDCNNACRAGGGACVSRPADARCAGAPPGHAHVCEGIGCFASPRCEGACASGEHCAHTPGAGVCTGVDALQSRAFSCVAAPDAAWQLPSADDADAVGAPEWLSLRESELPFFGINH